MPEHARQTPGSVDMSFSGVCNESEESQQKCAMSLKHHAEVEASFLSLVDRCTTSLLGGVPQFPSWLPWHRRFHTKSAAFIYIYICIKSVPCAFLASWAWVAQAPRAASAGIRTGGRSSKVEFGTTVQLQGFPLLSASVPASLYIGERVGCRLQVLDIMRDCHHALRGLCILMFVA